MRTTSDDDDGAPATMLERLERAAEHLNPFLLMIAIGLAFLDFTVFGLNFHHFPISHAAVDQTRDLPSEHRHRHAPPPGGVTAEMRSGLETK